MIICVFHRNLQHNTVRNRLEGLEKRGLCKLLCRQEWDSYFHRIRVRCSEDVKDDIRQWPEVSIVSWREEDAQEKQT